MPYKIVKSDDNWKILKEGSNKVISVHDSKEKAAKKVKLLYMVEQDKKSPRMRAMEKVIGDGQK